MKETKFCRNCKTEKPTTEFTPIANGFHSECKACAKVRFKEWQKKNRKRLSEKANRWYHANRELFLERQRLYRIKNAAKIKLRRTGEHYKNPERAKAKARKWAKENPEKRRANHLQREARKRSLPNDWTIEQMRDALSYWRNCCAACGCDLDGRHHWDHWLPLIYEKCPGTVADNMIPLCGRCNMRKNDSMPTAWLKKMFPPTWKQIKQRIENYLRSQLQCQKQLR